MPATGALQMTGKLTGCTLEGRRKGAQLKAVRIGMQKRYEARLWRSVAKSPG
jgi:hypothetical protein